jgi:hypothetical protein
MFSLALYTRPIFFTSLITGKGDFCRHGEQEKQKNGGRKMNEEKS